MFWDLYAKTYDSATSSFSGYKDLLALLVKELSLKKGDRLLDLGCGTANLEQELVKSNNEFSIHGIDISSGMLNYARKKVKDSRVEFEQFDLNSILNFKTLSFNKAIMIHSLYTLNSPLNTLKEVRKVLQTNGELIIVNPIKGASIKTMISYEKDKVGTFRIILKLLKNIPAQIINRIISIRATKSHYHFLDVQEYKDLLKKSGFKIKVMKLVYAKQSLYIKAIKV